MRLKRMTREENKCKICGLYEELHKTAKHKFIKDEQLRVESESDGVEGANKNI